RDGPARAGSLLERRGVIGEGCAGVGELALLGDRGDGRRRLSARRTMLGTGATPACGRNDLVVDCDLTRPEEHMDLVLGLANFDGLADELVGHGVELAVDVDVPLEIDYAL